MSRPKLLLADDSITIQKVVNLTFGDQGMDVFTFSDGDSAMSKFDEIQPDIVLADVHMPGMSGYRLCEQIRGNEIRRDTPVLLLVGSFEPFDQQEAERVGASGHLTKPFTSIADLISMVEDLVKRSAPPAPVEEERRPDTSDIDALYHQSFAETVEIPKTGTNGNVYEFGSLDDEMIQTSYAGQETEADDAFYPVDEPEEAGEPGQMAEAEAESLIADSVAESEDGPVDEALSEPPEAVANPFDSVAAEPPASAAASAPAPPEEIRFNVDDSDLLEIPLGASAPANGVAAAGDAPSKALSAADVSPELIELIVDKVVERLEQRAKTGAAHSVSGN